MAASKRRYVLLAGLVIIALAVALALAVYLRPKPKPIVLPNPNGYDTFVKASKMVTGDVGGFRQMNESALRAFVLQNSNALQTARQGFAQQSMVADNDSTNAADILAPLKQLNNVFCAEGRWAELDHRPDDAIRSYLDDLRFGQNLGRGGDLIFRLVSVAIEKFALTNLPSRPDAEQCKKIARALEDLDATEPPFAETLEQEKAYFDRQTSALMKLTPFPAMQRKMLAPALTKAASKVQDNQYVLRQMMIAYAARACELETKQPAKSISDLVPSYLKSVPQDPRTGKPMVYP